MKLKVGTSVRVISNRSGHDFNIGDVVIYVGMEEDEFPVFKRSTDPDFQTWTMYDDEYSVAMVIDWDNVEGEWWNECDPDMTCVRIFDWFKEAIEKQLNPTPHDK